MNLQPKQLEALQTLLSPQCKYLLYGGAMSGGKSYLLRWAAVTYLIELWTKYQIPNISIGLFSEDYPTLKDRQISRIEYEFPNWLGQLRDDKIHGLSYQLSPKLGGGLILLRNLDDPSKYMSTEFAGEFVEELTRNSEDTFIALRNRLRYPGINEVKFMGATNPGGVGHGWVRKLFIDHNTTDPEQDRFIYVHANAYDNQYISPEYIKQLEALPENLRKAYLEGSWDVFAGQFFTDWSPEKHIIHPFVPAQDEVIVGGMDWGRAKPFSFHLATVNKVIYRNTDGENQTFYRTKTFYEMYGIEKNPEDWAKLIQEDLLDKLSMSLSDISWVQCDPTIFNKGNDNSVSIRDQFYRVDPRWMFLKPAKNDRIPGWAIMHNWLGIAPDGKPYWQVTSNCKNLIRTLPELIYDENIAEDVDTEGEDHAADDQRYMLRNIKWLDGKTGQIKPKYEALIGHQTKFYTENEDMDQHLIDFDKFR